MFPFNEKTYQYMKWAAAICIPAAATLVGTVGSATGWDLTGVVVTIIAGAGTFIGALVGVSNVEYNKTTTQEESKSGATD
jgi:hypothetical protein